MAKWLKLYAFIIICKLHICSVA